LPEQLARGGALRAVALENYVYNRHVIRTHPYFYALFFFGLPVDFNLFKG